MRRDESPPTALGDVKGMFNLFSVVCDLVAFPVMIFSVRWGTWGRRFLASPATFGIFWPFVFVTFYGPHPQLGSVGLFWCASVAALFVHQIKAARRWRAGERPASRYWGESRLQRGGGLDDQRRARERVAGLAFLLGLACALFWLKPLGTLIAISAVAKLISDSLAFDAAESRLRTMEDARLENDWYLAEHRRRTAMD